MDNDHQPPNSTTSLSTSTSSHSSSQPSHPPSLFDFDFDHLIDSDDPGFTVPSDTEADDISEDISVSNDTDTDSDSDFGTTELYDLTTLLETEFRAQPKSTQLVLTHEVAKLFEAYEKHGSAARLEVELLEFLDAGEVVEREVRREVEGEGVGVGGRKAERKTLERARLRFQELPGGDYGGSGSGNAGVKRKAETNGNRGASRERRRGPVGGFGDMHASAGYVDGGGKLSIGGTCGTPTRPGTAMRVFSGMGDAMDVDGPVDKQGYTPDQYDFRGLLSRPGAQNQPPSISSMNPWPRQEHTLPLHHAPGLFQPQPPTLTPTPLTDPSLHHQYSLTNDLETQALLLGPNPTIPFHPLADVNIAIPLPTSHQQTQNQPYPTSLLETTTRILHLHSLSAVRFYTSLCQKHSLPLSSSGPIPPQPPAALFRLGITARWTHELENMYLPATEDEIGLGPDARRTLKDLYTGLRMAMEEVGVPSGDQQQDQQGQQDNSNDNDGNNSNEEDIPTSNSPLNLIETTLVAKAAGTTEDAVEEWWAKRGKGLEPWTALCIWVERREGEAILAAREGGWF